MSRLLDALRRFQSHTGGTTAMEYGLIVALLSIVVIGAVTAVGTGLFTATSNLSTQIAGH